MNIKGMDRRGFLGIFGGAAVAGPKLAVGIVNDMASAIPPAPYALASTTGQAVVGYAEDDWKLGRIKELKAVISGKDPQAEHNNRMNRLYALEQGERFRLDSLRSVSPVHKQRMLADSAADRQRRIRQADAEWDLMRLLTGN